MSVPFIDLKRFEPDFLARWAEMCQSISANTRFIAGPEANKLEQTLAEEAGVAEVVGCANGTDALQLALRAAGVGFGDVVLIPDSTFWATFEAVVNVGAFPVTVDINPTDLQMDYDLFVEAVEKVQPKAAILVHLYGWGSTRLDDFRSYCKTKDLPLIEDGAQAYGVQWKGQSIYRDAYLSTISFYVAKVLGACGDAGAVYCSTTELAEQVRCLSNHGRTAHYGHGMVGWNSRMGGFESAYLNLSLEYIKERIDSRREAAEWYQTELPKIGVQAVLPPDGYTENGYLNVTLHSPEIRERLANGLKERGIGYGMVYPGAMSDQPGAASFLRDKVGGDNARNLAKSVLNLPLFAYITRQEQEEVLQALKELH